MKTFLKILIALILVFPAAAQTSESSKSYDEIISSELKKEDNSKISNLIINKDVFLGLSVYSYLDGEKIPYSDLNKMLKNDADQIFVKRMKVSKFLSNAFWIGMFSSLAVSLYADNKGWDDMSDNSFFIAESCFAAAFLSDICYILNRNLAVESYNLKLLGLNQEK